MIELLETTTSRGRRFYIAGRQISAARAHDLKERARQEGGIDSFVTRCEGETTRQYCTLRIDG